MPIRGEELVNKSRIKRVLAVALAVSFAMGAFTLVFSGGGHDETGKLEHVVSLEGKTGVNLLMAKWYNENRLLYATVVTATMAFLGVVVGQITEFLLKLFGMK